MIDLDKDNLEFYAIRNYTNKSCLTEEEFKHDFNRVSLISRLLNKYIRNRDTFPTRLFLNHIITFYNVFEIKAATNILTALFDEDPRKMAVIKTCLIYLNYINDSVLQDTYIDTYIVKQLQEI
jgi:hypothetical protein